MSTATRTAGSAVDTASANCCFARMKKLRRGQATFARTGLFEPGGVPGLLERLAHCEFGNAPAIQPKIREKHRRVDYLREKH